MLERPGLGPPEESGRFEFDTFPAMRAAQQSAIEKDMKLFQTVIAVAGNGGAMDEHVKKTELRRKENDGPFLENEGGHDKRHGE